MKTSAASLAAAIGVLGVQVVALVSLRPTEFGLFSMLYLLSGLVLSISLSVMCDTWARARRASPTEPEDWGAYGPASAYLVLLGALLAVVVAVIVPGLAPHWWLIGVAVFATGYRSAARYVSLHQGRWREVLPGDIAGAVVAIGAGVWALWAARGDLGAVLAVWAASAAAGAVLSRRPRLRTPRVLVDWVRRHRTTISPLLRDSLLMDVSAIGTPYSMIPLLGVAEFGLYRAVSNVAAPVRLLLNPIRPRLAIMTPSARVGLLTGAAGLVMGGLAITALRVIEWMQWDLGTLSQLVVLAVPTGVFVAANLHGHAFYLFARGHSSARALIVGRVVQTLLGIVMPISGALLGGLTGAVWMYALATVASAAVWTIVVYRGGRLSLS